jgi:tetraacyldisaccharide-1-P 4'-kinase
MTKVDQAAEGSREHIRSTVHRYNEDALIMESIHQPRCLIPMVEWYKNISGDGLDVSEIRGKHIMAVSAIGNPASFEQTLSDLGVTIIESLRYPDHHDYSMQEMADILHQAERMGAEAIVITEKDAVKIPMEVIHAGISVPVYVICVEVNFQQGKDEFKTLLAQRLAAKLGK